MSFNLIPRPKDVAAQHEPPFVITPDTVIVARGDAVSAGWLWHDAARAATGFALPVVPETTADSTITFVVDGDRPDDATTAAEAYRIVVGTDAVTVTAAHPAGLARAVATLRQLLPPTALRAAAINEGPVELPSVVIDDEPRFAWRGVMIDVARHFQPKSFLLRLIDAAALHRLNVIHLHLTDDQGWRLEVPQWPLLTEIGSWRTETVIGHALSEQGYDGTPHGGFYTRDDLREIVAYAARHHITIVPEIDLPGHVRSVLAGYPELGNTGEPSTVATTFGIFSEVLAPTDEALRFTQDVFDTVVDVFPSPYIHIGGDECPRSEWRASPAAVAKAAELGLDNVDHLQSWFTERFSEQLARHGRAIIGWDEILDGGAPADAVIQVWRDFAIAAKAAAKGHRVIIAPTEAVYLDYYPSTLSEEPLHIHNMNTLDEIGGFEPVPEGVDDALVFGVQAQLWTEYMPTPEHVEYAAFPRLAAVADLAWAGKAARAEDPFSDRIEGHLDRLDAVGINYRPLDGPHPWQRGGTGRRRRFDLTDENRPERPDLPGH
ncbi:beta-N-acetylhexosaminidase [Stackebrandtia soli]|uniref:beta-N-acetylhexosaminidase n=1 Tax=Stackebrandtia soli TaxID=1892856 RepID=UPI0039E7CEDF